MKSSILLVSLAGAVGFLAAADLNSDEQRKDTARPKPDTSDTFIGKEAGQVRDDNGLTMKLVWCPPGIFTMENIEVITQPTAYEQGKPKADYDDVVVDPKDESAPKPRQTTRVSPVRVFLSKGYWLGKYEVTQSEWKQVMKTEPWNGQMLTKEGADFPATWVTWDDASNFCRKLTEQEQQAGRLLDGWEYTLPTEAQWERACRARTETRFSFGDDESKLGDHAWYFDSAEKLGDRFAHRVGQKKANPWGLCDMHGNVWEWCRDVYTQKLPGGRDPEVKSDEKTGASLRVSRGGSWGDGAAYCRSGVRVWFQPDFRYNSRGFRPALSAVR